MLTVKSKGSQKKLMLDADILNILYPIGSLYLTTSAANPGNTLGGNWTLVAPGRCLVGYNANDGDFNQVEKTGGEKTHKLTIDEMPSHKHSGSTNTTGAHTHTYQGWWTFQSVVANQQCVSRNRTNDAAETGTFSSAGNHSHSLNINNSGGGNSFNILSPYFVIKIWKRTA